jgi:cytochrome c oxidase cbb3-type subunit III
MRFLPGMPLLKFLLFVAACTAQTPSADEFRNPLAGRADAIEAGRGLYLKSCAGCHGPTGEGGRGPNLVTGRQIRRASDRQVYASIEKGVPGTDMPPTPLAENAIWQLVAYVRSLSAPAFDVPVPGDERAGAILFQAKGRCAECHAIAGRGGSLGPDLTNLGMNRSLNQIREAVLKPSERWAEGYQAVSVHLKDGREIRGVLRDRTNYQVTVLDAQGELHRLRTSAVADFKLSAQSLMPETRGRLEPEEIRDLLKFLSRQSARPAREVAP